MNKIKKENYFADQEFKSEIRQIIPVQNKNFLDLKKSVLIVLDMQEFFISKDYHAFVPAAKEIVPKIELISEKFLENQLAVIQTRHVNNEDNAHNMSKWWRDIIEENNKNSEITQKLQNGKVPVIKKCQYDSFYKTDLNKIIKTKQSKQIIICGLMAHLCCETTARTAFVKGYEVFFLYDMVASYNREFHLATVRNLSHGFADMISYDHILQKIEDL